MLTGKSSRFAGEKVLVADDERAIIDLATMFLRDRGFQILSACDGHECLDVVEHENPALVLLDYMMPVMDGMTALEKIRDQYPDTYVIMLTGKGSEEVAVSLMKAGASDYLQKPFSNINLLERIDNVLQLRQIGMENRQLLEEQERLRHEIEGWNRELEDRVQQKNAELERAHAEILQVEKLAALGHISAGLAHEIRNPLNSINLFAQLLKSSLKENPELRGYLDNVTEEVERIDNILIQMLAASKGTERQHCSIRLADCLRRVLDLCDVQIRSQGIEVNVDIAEDSALFKADEIEFEQIFSNLIGNALFEMPSGGTLTLRVFTEEDLLKIQVSDTGKGIPPEDFTRVFDPFFTTKVKGTGFGLSVVLRIVKGYNGRIHVESPESGGATFLIELPLTSFVEE
ncbi:MAG TPA: response regulator [Geopsychrobacteraceae bacterium]|nr:response regulator [Geopsychrobacteraceae bacterium]